MTDDPETPGAGHWEINVAVIASQTSSGRRELAAPDADINYGYGDHAQLKLDVPWTFVHESGEHSKSGLGFPNLGVKWRFLDREDAGFSMSTYPQLVWNWPASSARRGIVAPGRQFFLPVEAATTVADFGLDAEIGRNFVEKGPDQWAAGFIVAHACGPHIECMDEVRETIVPHDAQTLVNFGVHWKLNESLFGLASAGRELGPHNDDQRRSLFYLGLQILR